MYLHNIVSSNESENIHDEETCKDDTFEKFNLDMVLEEFKTAREYKFIYLVYAVSRESQYFTPYNFKIVEYKNINKYCYFTLSNKGILSKIQNEETFIPLEKFEEDYYIYKKLIKVIRYFYKTLICIINII